MQIHPKKETSEILQYETIIITIFIALHIPMKKSMKKILLILFLSIAVASCMKEKSFSFEEKVYQKILLDTCVDEDCTEIKITTAEIVDPQNEIADRINKDNLSIINEILSFENEKKQATNYDSIVISFTNAYTNMVKKFPKATIPWQAKANNIVTFYGDNLISFALDYYIFTGGANGFQGEKTMHYNPATGEQYSKEQLFKNYGDFKKLVINKLKELNDNGKEKATNISELSLEEDSLEMPENIFIYEDSVVLNFTTTDVSTVASKVITISFTQEEIVPYLSFELKPKPNTNK